MAGIPSHTKNSPPKKGSGSTREKAKSQSGQRKSGSSSSSREEPLETSASRPAAVSVDSSSSLLFLTTSEEPSSFKAREIQKQISQHVMKDYRDKQQSSKESSSRAKGKQVSKHQGDEETVISTNTPLSNIPIRVSSVRSTMLRCLMKSNQNTGPYKQWIQHVTSQHTLQFSLDAEHELSFKYRPQFIRFSATRRQIAI